MSSTPDLRAVLATLAQLSQPQQPPQHVIPPSIPPEQNMAQARPIIDPATIITWQEGLRCVTKIAAQNKQFAGSIRALMTRQRGQEMHWYSQRQQLKQAQARRQRNAAQARSILQSLTSDQGQTPTTDEERQAELDAELAAFDRKIYDEQRALQDEMTIELKNIGVPFFGTHANLIRTDPGDGQSEESAPITISRSELRSLQSRMIDHLEVLYRES